MMKRVTDPEEILILWKAGLMVHASGLPWGSRYLGERRARTDIEAMLRLFPHNCCVNVEEDGDAS